MAFSLQIGFPTVPRSITNPNVKRIDALDVNAPFTLLDFVKTINASFDPDSLQNYYNNYILEWNNYNKNKETSSEVSILDKYKEFLKEIILNYTTLEEKKYLSKLDFNDPYDMDIALGFYGKKIKELCDFYNSKRENAKFGVIESKLRGTSLGTNTKLKNLILSYIKNLDDSKMLFDIEEITSKIEIEIEELYDTYPLYFNQKPNEKIYDNKDLDYGLNIFLKDNQTIISEVFSDVSDELKQLKELDDLLDNKRKLTQKYISNDFYYLSTGNNKNNYVIDKLFDNDKDITNFTNRNYPTTASTERGFLSPESEVGFFRPTNVSFIMIDGVTDSFSVNTDNLSPNSLYFFPDPNRYGNDLGILEFKINDSFLKKNSTSGNAKNQPTSYQYDTKTNGYTSKIDPNIRKYMTDIFNSGYIKNYTTDIYGNSYALFKNGFDKYVINRTPTDIIYNVLFNGYTFSDKLYNEGYYFDYFVEDYTTYTETFRTGLSTNTYSFSSIEPDISLEFGRFSPYFELIEPTEYNIKKRYRYIDGAFFIKPEPYSVPYPDPVSSDLSAFEFSTELFYYSTLIDGGIKLSTTRSLLDPSYPSLSATFLDFPQASSFKTLDNGRFSDNLKFSDTNNNIYIDESTNSTELISQTAFSGFDNKVLIKNKISKDVKPLFEALDYLSTKYSSEIIDQMENNVVAIDSAFDVLFLETDNYLTINKISYENGEFVDPKTSSLYIEHSTDNYNKLSNRFKINNKVYYCVLQSDGSYTSNDLAIYPTIYEFDLNSFNNSILYTPEQYELSSFYVDGYVDRTDTPRITYNSVNNIFNISYLQKNQNNIPQIRSIDFYISSDVNILSNTIYQLTDIFNDDSIQTSLSSNLYIYLSSSPISIDEEEIIL